MDIVVVQKEMANILMKKGWKDIRFSTRLPESSGTFDIVASSKGIRKKMLVIAIATDPNDAEIASVLLLGIDAKYQKLIYLMFGDPLFAQVPSAIKLITRYEDLPDA